MHTRMPPPPPLLQAPPPPAPAAGLPPTASANTAASCCSLDALERLVHFTGAGADACFYGAPPAADGTAPSGNSLRYWLNPSVRARQTTATCEIANLGPPFFAATSRSLLRLTVAPLFADGRCCPAQCVVSLATSAQRLDGVSLRPVVVTQWALHRPSPDTDFTTTVPLRTLYHLAYLMSSSPPAEEMARVRLYLHLRFTGCSDSSDTHRIASVRLQYEALGAAAEVLPRLLQQRQSATAATSSGRIASVVEAYLDEVEVDVTASTRSSASASSSVASVHIVREAGGPVPRSAASRHEPRLPHSPPQRSATRPRADSSPSGEESGRDRLRMEAAADAAAKRQCGTSAEIVRVERALRLPPPPPPAQSAPSQPHTLSTSTANGPWPPRKVRTIVLAPSISPSLTSASSPPPPSSASSRSSTATLPLEASALQDSPFPHRPTPPPETRADSDALQGPLPYSAQPHASTYGLARDDQWARSGGADEASRRSSSSHGSTRRSLTKKVATSLPGSSAGPSRGGSSSSSDQHRASSSAERWTASATTASRDRCATGEPSPDPLPHSATPDSSLPPHTPHLRTRSDPAVLWAATSLLGTAPWALSSSQQHSRRGTPAGSLAGSRAPSREGSGRAASSSRSSTSVDAARQWRESSTHAAAPATSWRPWSSLLPRGTAVQSSFHSAHTGRCDASTDTTEDGGHTVDATPLLAPWRTSHGSSGGGPSTSGGKAPSAQPRVAPQLREARPAGTSASLNTSVFARNSQLPHGADRSGMSATPATVEWATQVRPYSAFVPRVRLRRGGSDAPINAAVAAGTAASTTSPMWRAQRDVTPQDAERVRSVAAPPPSQNRSLWSRTAAAPVPTSASALPAKAAWSGMNTTGPPPQRPASASLSVIPTSWLQAHAVTKRRSTPTAWSAAAAQQSSQPTSRAVEPRPRTAGDSPQKLPATAAATTAAVVPNVEAADALQRTSRQDSTDSAAPPPPPTAPPPPRRALFHRASSAATSSRASSGDSSRLSQRPLDPDAAPPALPLKEADFPHPTAPPPKGEDCAEAQVAEREPTKPPHRPRQRSGSGAATAAASRETSRGTGGADTGAAESFVVWKHHVSRRGTGRRTLRVERCAAPVSGSAAGEAVRFRVSLEKVRPATTGMASCAVSLLWRDAVEVWCGLRAYHSGLVHQSKVHRAECCVVVWCNAQLVTAVEMDSTASVEAVRRLLSTRDSTARRRSH